MRKYVLGVVTMVLSYALFSFTEVKEQKTTGSQQLHYWIWNEGAEEWEEVESTDDFPPCPPGEDVECTAISTNVSDGQPSGTVNIQYRAD